MISAAAARSLQRRFLFVDENSAEPLLPIAALRAALKRDEDAVLYLIEDHQLPFAFDIGMPGTRRRDLRVWRGCLPLGSRTTAGLEEVIEDILGSEVYQLIKTPELAKRWVCSPTHIYQLIEANELTESVQPERKATAVRWVTRVSAEAFLKRRIA